MLIGPSKIVTIGSSVGRMVPTLPPAQQNPGMVGHNCNLCSQGVEAEGSV